MSAVPEELIQLSHELGKPERRYVIIGEGNTSQRAADETFWVKSSTLMPSSMPAAIFRTE